MKKFSVLSAVGVAGILCLMPGNARADLEVGASVSIHATADFDAPLAGCGTWVSVGSYGRCWRPAGVAVDWQPYCEGEWVWTDCGWYWQSDEPWAWACYHYGYWVDDPVYGWIWIPGVDWAPAWVCWRIGGGCIGWAPLCPPGHFFARRPADAAFVFVDNDHFGGHIGTSVIFHGNRQDLIQRTKFISNVRVTSRDVDGSSHRVAFNEGPGLAAIQKATRKEFKAVPISAEVRRTPVPTRFDLPHNSVNRPVQPAKPETRDSQNHDRHTPYLPANQHPGNNKPQPPPTKPQNNQAPEKRYNDQGQTGLGPGGDQGGNRGQGGGGGGDQGEGRDHGHDHDR